MSYNFHIGQEIVALVNHSQGAFKKDDLFTVNGIKLSECLCNYTLVDIGIKLKYKPYYTCELCNKKVQQHTNWWFHSTVFAPLDSLTNIDELTEILSQPLFEVK